MKSALQVLGLVSVLFLATSAWAQKTQPVTEYDMEGDEFEGVILKPDGSDHRVTSHKKTSSLIKVRGSFLKEVMESANDI